MDWLSEEIKSFASYAIASAGGRGATGPRAGNRHAGTIARLSKRSTIDQSTIRGMLRGEIVSVRVLAKIAEALGMKFTIRWDGASPKGPGTTREDSK